jgi:glutamyl-tRNA reductase
LGKINRNTFFLIGISYKTAPVEIREQFSWNDEVVSSVLRSIHAIHGVRECVVLSTCNRTEIYATINDDHENVVERINRFIIDTWGKDKHLLTYFYYMKGSDVIEHLFSVASGIDSMILGEPEIFGQVKNAYSLACDNKCTGPIINRLFHQAFQVGKHIRNSTTIGEGAVSVSSAAVALIKEKLNSLKDCSVLLAGAGKIGRLCAKQLVDLSVKKLYIANRTQKHAEALAQELSGEVIPFETMDRVFGEADIIITSITASKPVITRQNLAPWNERRQNKPLFLIDLGVPRNVDSDVSGMGNVHYFNIDDLENVTMDNQDRRKTEAEKAKDIIKKEVDGYLRWLKEREVIPVIQGLYEKCETLRLEELGKIKNKVNPDTFEIIDLVTRRVVRKILHNPTVTIRLSESGETRTRLMETIQELFMKETQSALNGKLIDE